MEVLASRVLLRPADPEASLAFYRDLVGLHVFREYGSGAHHGVVFFCGGGYLEVSGTGPRHDSGRLALWWQVRDLDAEHARLTAGGVRFDEVPQDMPWGLREARLRDPDGVPIVLVEVPDDHPLRRDTRG